MEDGLSSAVLDNARWCHLVCRGQGIDGRFDPDAWVSSQRTPDGYPDAVTLSVGAAGDAVLSRIDASPGCSIKDSYASLDLSGRGFRILFDGAWVRRPAGRVSASARGTGGLHWTRVTEPGDLTAWAADHGGGSTFSAQLLDEPSVLILAARDPAGRLVEGAIATVGDRAVGISNVFASRAAAGDATESTRDAAESIRFEEAFAAATAAIAERFPDRVIVGYLSASRLPAARGVEYVAIGPMRVWILDEP